MVNRKLNIANRQLKTFLSISFLLTFLLFQGGRVLMYLECRFTNTITTPNCDCVQILADAKPGVDAIPINNAHANHKHLPDEFEMLTANLHHATVCLNTATIVLPPARIAAGVHAEIFHPPLA